MQGGYRFVGVWGFRAFRLLGCRALLLEGIAGWCWRSGFEIVGCRGLGFLGVV